MTKSRLILVLAVMALVLTLPSVVSAQRLPPHVFVAGMINGAMPVDGTVITAIVNDTEVATATVVDGQFTLVVDQGDQSFAGMNVHFTVDGMEAMEAPAWEQGGGTELNLTTGVTPGRVVTTAWSGLSQYLVDDRGMSLYLFTVDTQGTDSTAPVAKCTSAGCMGAWPPLWTAGDPVAKEQPEFAGGAKADLLGTLEWADGNVQVTYNGWPVYYYFKDLAPGDVYGQYGPWFLLAPQGTALVGGTNVDPAGPPQDGAQGETGSRGATGSKGDTGDTGDTGDAGSAGRAGAAGSAGAAGPAGAAGAQGAAGSAGPAGTAGPAGAEGDDGSGVLGIVALILAIVALLGAGGVFFLRRGT